MFQYNNLQFILLKRAKFETPTLTYSVRNSIKLVQSSSMELDDILKKKNSSV